MSRKNPDGYEPDEIAITPQMIEAGVAALFTWSGEFDFERLTPSELSELVVDILTSAIKTQ